MKYDNKTIKELQETARRVRCGMIESIGVGVAGHVGGGCSSADILTALYFYKMKFDPKDPKNPDRDRFLLSKGHAAIVQYSALAEAGAFPKEELKKTKSIGAMLQGHPDVKKTPGIEAGTGSLGQGLSIGLGMALGMKLDKVKRKVYVVIGDGEMAEGQIWEAAMAASAYKADNLVAILDKNRLQATGLCCERFDTGDAKAKWEAFGWHVLEVDGHDMEQLLDALDEADTIKGQPVMIIANTVKGKGVSFAENVVSFHNGALTEENYKLAIEDLSSAQEVKQ
jgi:transketolase